MWWTPPTPLLKRPGVAWLVAAAATAPFAFVLLMAGLVSDGLGLVYASIAVSLAFVPLLLIGIVRLVTGRRPVP